MKKNIFKFAYIAVAVAVMIVGRPTSVFAFGGCDSCMGNCSSSVSSCTQGCNSAAEHADDACFNQIGNGATVDQCQQIAEQAGQDALACNQNCGESAYYCQLSCEAMCDE